MQGHQNEATTGAPSDNLNQSRQAIKAELLAAKNTYSDHIRPICEKVLAVAEDELQGAAEAGRRTLLEHATTVNSRVIEETNRALAPVMTSATLFMIMAHIEDQIASLEQGGAAILQEWEAQVAAIESRTMEGLRSAVESGLAAADAAVGEVCDQLIEDLDKDDSEASRWLKAGADGGGSALLANELHPCLNELTTIFKEACEAELKPLIRQLLPEGMNSSTAAFARVGDERSGQQERSGDASSD